MALPNSAATTTDTLTGALGVVVADAVVELNKAGLAWRLLRKQKAAKGVNTVRFPVWTSLTSANVTQLSAGAEGTPLTYVTGSSSAVNIEPLRNVIGEQVTFLADDGNAGDTLATMGGMLGNALAAHMDKVVFKDMVDSTTSTIGTGSTALTLDKVNEAVAKLRNANITGPYYCVAHPSQIVGPYGLSSELVQASSTAVGSVGSAGLNLIDNGEVGMIAGVRFFWSPEVTSSIDGANTVAKAIMFSQNAQGIAYKDRAGNGSFINPTVTPDADTDSNKVVFNGYWNTDQLFASASTVILSKI